MTTPDPHGSRAAAMPANLLQPPMAGGAQAGPDLLEQWRQPGASVPLGQLAEIRVNWSCGAGIFRL